MLKKFTFALVCAFSFMVVSSCGSSDRSELLKVYNWGDYIDEDLIPEFEQWYEQQTGEKVRIIYQTFDINETMLSKIEKGQEDYDVVCPSDYIIERMLKNDLLLPIDRDFGNTPNYIDDNISPYIKDCFNLIDGGDKNANDYSVGYMWGTTGILYNRRYVADEDATTWDIIRNPKYAGKIFMKDAARDVYGPVLIYLKQDELKSGKTTLDALAYDSTEESIAAVKAYMGQVKDLVAGWEADFGKEQMTQEKGYVNFTWSGDAAWAIEEAAEVGVDLNYVVPEEGSNVWFDGWVIPKFAKNVKAAKYFINFMCKPENAVRNMDVIGYVSAVCADEVIDYIKDDSFDALDLSYFFGEKGSNLRANPTFYPGKSVIDRCTMMHDWGEDSAKLIKMWSEIKGSNANTFTFVIIIATLAVLVFAVIANRTKRNRRRSRH